MSARAVAFVTLAAAVGWAASAMAAPGHRAFDAAPASLREEVVLAGTLVGRSRLDLNRFEDPRSPEAVSRPEVKTRMRRRISRTSRTRRIARGRRVTRTKTSTTASTTASTKRLSGPACEQ